MSDRCKFKNNLIISTAVGDWYSLGGEHKLP